jgi:DNA-binding winged helix-turn-helix (wHTH) protein
MMYAFGPFELDARRFELRRHGEIVPMQRRAFDLLLHLVRNAGAVCTREQLRVEVWEGAVVSKDALAHAALAVRGALDDDGGTLVRTVRGRGYSFAGTVMRKNGVDSRGAVVDMEDPLVGRAPAISVFYDRLARAARGEGSVVWLRGEIGAGKTRLLEELASHESGKRTVLIRAEQGRGSHTALRWLLRKHREQNVQLGALLGMLVEESNMPSSADPVGREQVVEELVSTWRHQGRCDPVVVAFDDLDEADAETIELVLALARRLSSLPVVIIVSTTPGSRGSAAIEARPELASSGAVRIDLEPFTREQISVYAERALGVELGRSTIDTIHLESNGNPLFVRALVRGLASDDAEGIVGRLRRRMSDDDVSALVDCAKQGPAFAAGDADPALERARELRLVERETASSNRHAFVEPALATALREWGASRPVAAAL